MAIMNNLKQKKNISENYLQKYYQIIMHVTDYITGGGASPGGTTG